MYSPTTRGFRVSMCKKEKKNKQKENIYKTAEYAQPIEYLETDVPKYRHI